MRTNIVLLQSELACWNRSLDWQNTKVYIYKLNNSRRRVTGMISQGRGTSITEYYIPKIAMPSDHMNVIMCFERIWRTAIYCPSVVILVTLHSFPGKHSPKRETPDSVCKLILRSVHQGPSFRVGILSQSFCGKYHPALPNGSPEIIGLICPGSVPRPVLRVNVLAHAWESPVWPVHPQHDRTCQRRP